MDVSFGVLVYPERKKPLFFLYVIICGIYEVILIIFLAVNPDSVAIVGTFDSKAGILVIVFQVFSILTALITGILFANRSRTSKDETVRIKGTFLMIAFISFTAGGLLDVILPATPTAIVIIRLILISSAVEYYLGFLLPDRIAAILTGNK